MIRVLILLVGLGMVLPIARADEPKVPKPAQEAKALIGAFEAFAEAIGEFAGTMGGKIENEEQNEFVRQFSPQFQHVLKTELLFIRKVCQPSPEQYQAIQQAGDASLKKAVRRFADDQVKMQRGQSENQSLSDPRQAVAGELAKKIEATLSVEQMRRYQTELDKRAAARKRAGLLCMVARLDKDLILSAEQRDKLKDVLDKKWSDAWSKNLEAMMYGSQFMPVVPDDLLLPVLNETQKEIWRQTPRQNNVLWGFAGLGFVQAVDVEELAPAEEKAAPEKAVPEKPVAEKAVPEKAPEK